MSPRFGLVIDQERCIGCETCTVACQAENRPEAGPWIRVETLGAGKDAPAGRYPELRMDFLPRLCNHCTSPPCLDACPAGALQKRDDGVVVLTAGTCDGCEVCVAACPYDAIVFRPETGVAEKCNLCQHRIERGLEPFCVTCCEGQAMHFGDLADPSSRVSRLIAGRSSFTLKPELGTGPAVYYCAPRERRRL